MFPRAAKLWILAKLRKKNDRIFRNFFSSKSIDEFEDSEISMIRWQELRLGHNRALTVNRIWRASGNNVRDSSLANLKGPKYSGLLTPYAQLGIKRAFEKMLVYSEPFMAFDFRTGKRRSAVMVAWLITVPAHYGSVTGSTFNELVSELIKRIGQKYPKFRMYLGKVEFTGNGMEHCHLDVNTFIDYYWLHTSWFTILKNQKCFQDWLRDHPKNDPDHIEFDPKSKDNLVGYRPLWTSSGCVSYLNNYLKKMTQNKIPVKGKVWFQSKYLARTPLPLLVFSNEQYYLLQQGVDNDHINCYSVELNSYLVDGDAVITDNLYHSKKLCTIWKKVYSKDKKYSPGIKDYLTDDNVKRLISYRSAARECSDLPSAHGAVFGFKVIYNKPVYVKTVDGRPPGINSLPDVPSVKTNSLKSSPVLYSKVEFQNL